VVKAREQLIDIDSYLFDPSCLPVSLRLLLVSLEVVFDSLLCRHAALSRCTGLCA